MIGAPPGYVGYEKGGILTEKVRRHPYSVILFDEIEKAHRDVADLLLQITDDGSLTDSEGRRVNFRNTYIILTSNAGFSIGDHGEAGFISSGQSVKLGEYFRGELLGRIDETVYFKPLSRETLRRIALKHVEELKARLKRSAGVSLEYDSLTVDCILHDVDTRKNGARDIERAVTAKIENKVADMIVTGALHDGSILLISGVGGNLEFIIKNNFLEIAKVK